MLRSAASLTKLRIRLEGNAMNTKDQLHTGIDIDASSTSKTALKIFNRIARAWNLEESERLRLLGNQAGDDSIITTETVVRISYILGIYKNLRTIFQTEQRANEWVKKPNRTFGGKFALTVMTEDPATVRRYLDAQAR